MNLTLLNSVPSFQLLRLENRTFGKASSFNQSPILRFYDFYTQKVGPSIQTWLKVHRRLQSGSHLSLQTLHQNRQCCYSMSVPDPNRDPSVLYESGVSNSLFKMFLELEDKSQAPGKISGRHNMTRRAIRGQNRSLTVLCKIEIARPNLLHRSR